MFKRLDTPQKCIDALRRGDYSSVLNLGKLVYARYKPLNDNKVLGADDVTPLMASLIAETNITLDDIVKIQHGILSAQAGSQQQYYLTQLMSAATTLLSHEAYLMKQEDNQDKSPQEIRQMVRDEVAEAIKGCEDPKKEGAKKVVNTTIIEMDKEMVIVVEKKKAFQLVFAYAANHLIKKNVEPMRETGKLLSDYLDSIEAEIEALDKERDELENDLKQLIDQLPKEKDFSARKEELEKNIHLNQDRLDNIKRLPDGLRRNAYVRKLATENQLSFLIANPEKREEISLNEALSGVPIEESLQSLHQQIKSYIDFLENNRPSKYSILLNAYNARKSAAKNMLIAVTTSNLRTPEETLVYLENNTKVIENNRPGLLELGFIAWVKNFFKEYKAAMVETTDAALTSTQNELQTLRENFVERKNAFKAIKDGAEKDVANDPTNQSLLS
ncbi:hypothetical protein FOLKNPGA_00516 [Legionella sp. PC1000]|uniref:hypothetical protein n=1 Tax=Legionella sp. PC1000 TaxID=2746060 RepID=UPI0015FA8AFD|nr:hypothetical protein [Legionella sp. PC1000]QLZ67743.1 hypothetical protein FOLKNPGA_00516 [Legionella sp. PC1000]